MKVTGSRLKPRVGGTALVVTAVLALAACGSSSSNTAAPAAPTDSGSASSPSTPPPAPATVTFAQTIPSAPFAFLYAAAGATGAFADVEKKFNTKIKFLTVPNPSDATNAMLTGTVDLAFGGVQNYLIAQAAGKDISAVFIGDLGAPGVVIGAKKYESRGSDLSKYAGGSFGYTKEGSGSQLNLKYAAEKAGLDWSKLTHTAFGSPSAGLPLLKTGRLDVAAADPTSAVAAINAGTAYLIQNFSDQKTSGDLALILGTVYAFNKSFTTKYPELTKAVVQAMLTGLNAVKKVADDPAAVLALFPAETQTALTKGWADGWNLTKPGVIAADGTLSDKSVQVTLDYLKANKIVTDAQAATSSKVIDNSYLKG